MNFVSTIPDSWESLNDLIRTNLGLDDSVYVMGFTGLHHALMEASNGLYRQFPHKKKTHVFDFGTPYLKAIARNLSMEAKDLVLGTQSDLHNLEKYADLGREDLCAFIPEDHPVTGEIFDTKELKDAFWEKKVITVSIFHHPTHWLSLPKEHVRQELRICYVNSNLVFASAGVRSKFPAPIAQGMNWRHLLNEEGLRPEFVNNENREWVSSFEADLPEGFLPVLDGKDSRLWDRVVLRCPDLDGEALQWELAGLTGVSLPEDQVSPEIETTSPSRWSHLRTFEYMLDSPTSLKDVREILVIDSTWGQTVSLKEQLVEARKRVIEKQGDRLQGAKV
tara:strand:- start:13924 stop:14928 length:1005 start_codon:yes stop_codon:yes gene_type:complete